STGAGRDQLAGRAGHPLRRHLTQGLGWQPDLARCAGAIRVDVGVADVLGAGAISPGLPQSTPPGGAGCPGLAPVTRCANPYLSNDASIGALSPILCAYPFTGRGNKGTTRGGAENRRR